MCDSRAALLWLSVFKVLVTLYDLTCSIICVNTALQSGNLKQNFSRSSSNTETKNNMITCTGLSEESGIPVHFLPKLDHKELSVRVVLIYVSFAVSR